MKAITASDVGLGGDLDLVQRHRYGDPQAFEELYSRFGGMVYNLAVRLATDPDEAADLTQEIFLRIYRHLEGFRGGSSLKTWIYRVAVNHCRSRLARRRPPAEALADEEAGGRQVVARERSPEELTVAAEAGRRIAGALAELDPAFREAVVLRDLEGLSYEEIAAVLRVRIGTVRSRIARGREKLRAVLETSR